MPVIRVEKNRNYTVMANYHLKDKRLSLKAVGLLSRVLSLPDNWDFSVRGLSGICKESKNTIAGVLKELEETGYLERRQLRDTSGKLSGYEYIFREKPCPQKPCPKKRDTKNWDAIKYYLNQSLSESSTGAGGHSEAPAPLNNEHSTLDSGEVSPLL